MSADEKGRPCSCGKAQLGVPWSSNQCVHCWSWLNAPEYREARQGKPPARRTATASAIPCRHLGKTTGGTVPCPSCPNNPDKDAPRVPLLACAVHGTTTGRRGAPGNRSCFGCPDYSPRPSPLPVCITDLTPHLGPGQHLNGSIAEFDGRLWLCWRQNWSSSRLALQELGKDLFPFGPKHVLSLGRLPEDRHAQEDPRLFVARGRLHVAYTGYAPGPRGWYTSSCLAVIDAPTGRVLRSSCPALKGRQFWEKNWGYFEHENDLYAVHTISPHRVLHLEGHQAQDAYQTEWSPAWTHGLLRGGATPVRVGDEYWSVFHGWQDRDNNIVDYTAGLYTFEASPPFRPRRLAPMPLLRPGPLAGPGNPRVIFPGGLVRRGDFWLLCYGEHDAAVRLVTFAHANLEKVLVPV